jgi:hypothetical protein
MSILFALYLSEINSKHHICLSSLLLNYGFITSYVIIEKFMIYFTSEFDTLKSDSPLLKSIRPEMKKISSREEYCF